MSWFDKEKAEKMPFDPTNWSGTCRRSAMKTPKSLENSKSALVCCSDELRGWVSNNSPNSESCTSTSPFHPLELTGNFLVTVPKFLLNALKATDTRRI